MGIFDFCKNKNHEKELPQNQKGFLKSGIDLDLSGQFGKVLEDLEKTNGCFFITGKAGTGKSTLLKTYRDNSQKRVVCLAPTGIAAINIGGQTIHSFFRFPPVPLNEDHIYLSQNQVMYQNIDTLIIDEISMVRADLLDAVDKFLRLNRDNPHPFGGIQVLFFGDVFQLQPVVSTKEEQQFFHSFYQSPYFFDAKVFNDLDYRIIDLQKVFRQKDEAFIELLDSVRLNTITENQLERINSTYDPNNLSPDRDNHITLTSTNNLANNINNYHLSRIHDKEYSYLADIEGDFITRKSYPTDQVLRIKKGAQIMFVKNHISGRWVNGTIGKISNLGEDFVEVELIDEGEKIVYPVHREIWEMRKYYYNKLEHKLDTEIVGVFIQYPLRLAWAITIHKSQGLTFDNVVIDLGNGAFAHGQTYVALSRCTNLQGIILKKKINRTDIIVDLPVIRFCQQEVN